MQQRARGGTPVLHGLCESVTNFVLGMRRALADSPLALVLSAYTDAKVLHVPSPLTLSPYRAPLSPYRAGYVRSPSTLGPPPSALTAQVACLAEGVPAGSARFDRDGPAAAAGE